MKINHNVNWPRWNDFTNAELVMIAGSITSIYPPTVTNGVLEEIKHQLNWRQNKEDIKTIVDWVHTNMDCEADVNCIEFDPIIKVQMYMSEGYLRDFIIKDGTVSWSK